MKAQRKREVDPPQIETEEQYELAIGEIERLWEAPSGTSEAQLRDFLIRSVEEYEVKFEELG